MLVSLLLSENYKQKEKEQNLHQQRNNIIYQRFSFVLGRSRNAETTIQGEQK